MGSPIRCHMVLLFAALLLGGVLASWLSLDKPGWTHSCHGDTGQGSPLFLWCVQDKLRVGVVLELSLRAELEPALKKRGKTVTMRDGFPQLAT